MATDTAFSFKALSAPAQRHIRLFQIHQFLDRFAMGLTVAVVALALEERGMDLFQISLLFGLYAVTTMVLELPFGGLADSIGRKPVFLAAVAASLLSLALFLSTRDFYVLALSFVCIGFGRALRSGTLDAWFVETFRAEAPNVDVQPALARAQGANALGLALGAVLGGLLPDVLGPVFVAHVAHVGHVTHVTHVASIYDVSYLASFAVMLVVAGVTWRAIHEPKRALTAAALGQGFARLPEGLGDAGRLALAHPALPLLLAALALFLVATNPVEVLWPTHARPMLEDGFATTAIGALTATYFFAIAFGAALSPFVSRIFRRRHALTLAAVFAGLAAVQIGLAVQGGILGFAGVFVLYAVLLGLSETPASSILHRCVADGQRSTLLSLRSLIQQLGAALGLLLAGAVAEIYGTWIAWCLGAAGLALAALLALRLARRLAEMDR